MKDPRPILLIINLLIAGIIIAPQPAGAGPPPFGIGDWTVTGNETLENGCLMLDGDLTVASGGSLTLSNYSLTVHCDYSGEHALSVRPGGTLRVLNGSMVNSLGEWWTFNFTINQGATVDFEDSTFVTCGARLRGIMDRSDGAIIRNCTFTGAWYSLTTNTEIMNCTFSRNYVGLVGGSRILNCTFAENGLGAMSFGHFECCQFITNGIGAWGIRSGINLTNCVFLNNSGMGLYAAADAAEKMSERKGFVVDCDFTGNRVAIDCGHIEADFNGWVNITNTNFSDHSYQALRYARGNWTVNKPCQALNDTLPFDGNITVESGGWLTLNRSAIMVDNTPGKKDGITVKNGGRLELRDGSAIRAFNASFPYSFRCLPGSAFCMSDSLVRDCGWNLSDPATSGPLIETDNLTIISSTVDFNPAALVLNNSHGGIIERSFLRGMESPLLLDSSSLLLLNSTLAAAGDLSASLNNTSLLDCVNSTLNRTLLEFGDKGSRVNLSWYLDVRARWADGSPAEGAGVSVSDLSGAEVARGELDADGWLRGQVLREASLGLQEKVNFTPHAVNISRGSVFNRTLQRMDRSRVVDVVLEDRDAPSITIAYPAPEAFLSSGTVFVNGTARDNLGVEKVELIIDGFRRFTAYSADGPEQTVVGWNATLSFLEGPHTIEARAYDAAKNFASAVVSFTVDWSAPRVRIASPPDGYLTNLSLLPVSGFMEPGSRVLLDGAEVKTERDLFGGTVILGEGENLVTAAALDRAGNSNSSSVRVWLDTRPPALDVIWPPEGLRTSIPMVVVNGTMEPGAQVTVNGRPLVLTGAQGTFRTAVALPRETNLVVVDAVDPAGNHNLAVRTVVLDTQPPALEIESPPEGLVTNRPETILSGVTEGGAILSVNGDFSLVPGEPGQPAEFALPLRLPEGPNTIFISVTDGAGNLNFSTRHMVVDTLPPALSISAPADGHRTTRSTLFIIGETEPGVVLTINSRAVPVGQTGSFSLEVGLATGPNRFTVRAVDLAGNSNETVVDVRRIAASGDDIISTVVGPDWPFAGFIVISMGIALAEGWMASRYIRRKAGA